MTNCRHFINIVPQITLLKVWERSIKKKLNEPIVIPQTLGDSGQIKGHNLGFPIIIQTSNSEQLIVYIDNDDIKVGYILNFILKKHYHDKYSISDIKFFKGCKEFTDFNKQPIGKTHNTVLFLQLDISKMIPNNYCYLYIPNLTLDCDDDVYSQIKMFGLNPIYYGCHCEMFPSNSFEVFNGILNSYVRDVSKLESFNKTLKYCQIVLQKYAITHNFKDIEPIYAGIYLHLKYKNVPSFDLQQHQKDVCSFLNQPNHNGLLCYHQTGTGKTLTAIATITHYLQQDNTRVGIIVAPSSVIDQWKSNLNVFINPKVMDKENFMASFDIKRRLYVLSEHEFVELIKSNYIKKKRSIKQLHETIYSKSKKHKSQINQMVPPTQQITFYSDLPKIDMKKEADLTLLKQLNKYLIANPRKCMFVFDEAHNYRTPIRYNEESREWNTSYYVRIASCIYAEKLLYLTATPVINKLTDLKNMLQNMIIVSSSDPSQYIKSDFKTTPQLTEENMESELRNISGLIHFKIRDPNDRNYPTPIFKDVKLTVDFTSTYGRHYQDLIKKNAVKATIEDDKEASFYNNQDYSSYRIYQLLSQIKKRECQDSQKEIKHK